MPNASASYHEAFRLLGATMTSMLSVPLEERIKQQEGKRKKERDALPINEWVKLR